FSSRRRHTRCYRDWSSDVCSSDLSSIQEQYSVPLFGPALVSAPQAGYTRARRVAMAGIATSNATAVGEIVCVGPKLSPPSVELRSEERRVGKEGTGRMWTSQQRDK